MYKGTCKTACSLVVLIGLLAAIQLQPEPQDCPAMVEEIDRAFYARSEGGPGEWSDLDPLIAEAHRCFGDARTPEHAVLFNYETGVLVKERRFADALAVFDRFFADYASVATPTAIERMHRRRGYVYERLGWTVAMLVEYSTAAAMVDQLPPAEAAATLRSAGEQYRLVNDLDAAWRYLTRAESLLVPFFDQDSAAYGADLGAIRLRQADVVLSEGTQGLRSKQDAAERAMPLVQSALALIPGDSDFSAYYRGRALLTLAEVYWGQGRPERALAPIAEALRLSPMLLETYPARVATMWQDEGHTHFLLGHYDEANRAYETALAVSQVGQERETAMEALVGLGEVAEASASEDGLRTAEDYYRQAAAVAEEIRRTYGTHDWSAAAWERTQAPYLHLTRVLLRQGRAADAFLTLDETRARYLRDLRTSTRLRVHLDVRTATQLDSLTTALDDVRHTLRDPALSLAAHSELEARAMALQQRVDAILGPADVAAGALTLEAVQRALRPRGQVLLTYFLDDSLSTAFVVRADTFATVPLHVTPDALRAEVHRLGGLWAEGQRPDARLRLTPLHALYEAVYAPVAPLVPEGAPLLVIPDGPLAQVPFGMLLEHAHPPYDYADAPYLLRHHPITVELAAALLAERTPAAEAPLPLLALGRSRFGPVGSSRRGAGTLADLPQVGEELDQLRRRIADALIVQDDDATETFFDTHRDEARVIHLASHALVDAQHPLYSRVVLAPDSAHDDDGLLYLYELQERPLHADLVTLSGCSTARGRSRVGEGMMGLQYAFRAAGARATLATLWQVEDRATGALMDRFYLHLREGLPKDEALRRAQLDYLGGHEGAEASPFFWAAAVLYGDAAPVPLEAGGPSAALWLPAGLLLVLAGVALPRLAARVNGRTSARGKGRTVA